MSKEIKITLNYEHNDEIKPVLPTTDEACFETNGFSQITGYLCSDTISDIVIPSMIDGNKITSIGNGAFRDKQLTNVVIPESVTTIGSGAFLKASASNPNLTTMINKTNRAFDWGNITGSGASESFVTGTTSNGIQITAE